MYPAAAGWLSFGRKRGASTLVGYGPGLLKSNARFSPLETTSKIKTLG